MAKAKRVGPTFKSLMRWGLSAVFVVIFSFWANASLYTFKKRLDVWSIPPVKLRAFHPQYLSANDEEIIYFAIENSETNNIDVSFRLMNTGPLMNFANSAESNDVFSGTVKGHEQIQRQFKLFFPAGMGQTRSMRGQQAGLRLEGSTANGRSQNKDLNIGISPIPHAAHLSNSLSLVLLGLITWLCKELWDQAKEASKT
jgi:hypothetical protein